MTDFTAFRDHIGPILYDLVTSEDTYTWYNDYNRLIKAIECYPSITQIINLIKNNDPFIAPITATPRRYNRNLIFKHIPQATPIIPMPIPIQTQMAPCYNPGNQNPGTTLISSIPNTVASTVPIKNISVKKPFVRTRCQE